MYYLVLAIVIMLCGCTSDEPTVVREVKTVSGHLRYQADSGTLTADLLLPDSTGRPPAMLGQPMEQLGRDPGRRFRYAAERELPGLISFTVYVDEQEATFSFVAHGISVDSLPDTLYRDTSATFMVADRGLTERESLVVFFEPGDRSTPKRILVTGPTSSGLVSLPPVAIDDIAVGDYDVYLVKQRLFKDQIGTTKASLQTEYFTESKQIRVE